MNFFTFEITIEKFEEFDFDECLRFKTTLERDFKNFTPTKVLKKYFMSLTLRKVLNSKSHLRNLSGV